MKAKKRDEVNENLKKLNIELRAMCEKYGFNDYIFAVKGEAEYPDGKTGTFINFTQAGNRANAPIIAAYAFGEALARSREFINKIISGDTEH